MRYRLHPSSIVRELPVMGALCFVAAAVDGWGVFDMVYPGTGSDCDSWGCVSLFPIFAKAVGSDLVQEVLRLYPVAPITDRVAQQDMPPPAA